MFTPRHVYDQERRRQFSQGDVRTDTVTDAAADSTTSSDDAHEVATLRRQVEKLTHERDMLRVDNRVREELVDYLKQQFEDMVSTSLDNSQEIGRLKAENEPLRVLLPPQASQPTAPNPDGVGELDPPRVNNDQPHVF
jgi:hypothetical protein